jgi:predicted dehydrogenase
MSRRTTRRTFLKSGAALGAGVWVATRSEMSRAVGPNERLAVGVIGVGRRGADNLGALTKVGAAQVVAVCDIDPQFLADAGDTCPDAEQYDDFRVMLDKEKSLDAVLVSCADHTHAPASLMALGMGKHVYCEKPLAHNVFEARRMTELAAKNQLVTQQGTQIHAGENYRRVVEIVRSGVLGPVREVHCWVTKVWGAEKPKPAPPYPPVPKGLNYDAWLGPAEAWPYHPEWARGRWRQWWNFGNGTLGDMGCHYMDLPFWALGLKHPATVSAEGPPLDKDGCPVWLIVNYEFPSRPSTSAGQADAPPVKLTWYDGDKRPAPQMFKQWGFDDARWHNGVVFVGDKAQLIANYSILKITPRDGSAPIETPAPSIPRSIGHHAEWVEACRTGDPTAASCNFDYAGPLAETVLLGNVAYRTGKKIDWDAKNLRASNAPEADQFIRRAYRKGWEIA